MRIVVILLAAVVAASCGTDDRPARDSIRAEVEAARAPAYATRNKDARQLWKSTRDFYREREFAPVWLHNRRRRRRGWRRWSQPSNRPDRDGLDPRLYDIAFTAKAAATDGSASARKRRATIDVRLTFAYLQFASDLADGVSDLARSHPAWHMRPRTFDPAAHLTRRSPMGRSPNHSTR